MEFGIQKKKIFKNWTKFIKKIKKYYYVLEFKDKIY